MAAAVAAAVVGLAVFSGSGWNEDDPAAAPLTTGPNSGLPSGAANAGAVDDEGSEVIGEPESSATKEPSGLPKAKRTATDSLISSPLPRTATRRGALVAGFPLGAVPVLTGSAVSSSGVSSEANILQVSIVARNPRSPSSVLAYYRGVLTELGFSESTVPAVSGSIAADFNRGADHLGVTASRLNGQDTTYSLFGDLHASTND